ncbi:MAG: c-type cytochrome [Planctomycetes bacterium]|nr:c-type cytochrome [Planctomycetota bacterium]
MLVGVTAAGVWAEQADADHAGALFGPDVDLAAARPVLRVGQAAYFQLRSVDVLHSFYAPELGIGPFDVLPGREVVFRVLPEQEGSFSYYCTAICGDPHYAMRGEILVLGEDDVAPGSTAAPGPWIGRYWQKPEPAEADPISRGEWLYHRVGCHTCHGDRGAGGVPNFNAAGGFVPSLDGMAERLELFEPEEAEVFSRAVADGAEPEEVEGFPDTGDLERAASLFRDAADLIRNGRTVSKKDPGLPVPPLDMPAWSSRLEDADIRQILAYLITLQDWEGE